MKTISQTSDHFINFLTKEGKKSKAFSIFRKTLFLLAKKIQESPEILGENQVQIYKSVSSMTEESKFLTKDIFFLENAQGLKTEKFIFPVFQNISFNSEKLKIHSMGRVTSLFLQSIENVKPLFEVKRIRIAGTTQQVPSLVPFERQESLAIRWIIQGAKERKRKIVKLDFEECLALEIIEAFKKQGSARHKRDDLHKIAEANRAYSHYRWW